MIDESQAWGIAKFFARSVKKKLKSNLLALYTVGSLAEGDYIPGRSDIDTILITKHSLPDCTKEKVEAMAASFKTRYSIPKSIGSVIIEERLLRHPYGADIDLMPEILRLKLQGKVVVGGYNLEKVPMPFRKYMDCYKIPHLASCASHRQKASGLKNCRSHNKHHSLRTQIQHLV